MIERNILLNKWQFVASSIVALTGAVLGGIYGSFFAAFAGDSWWTSDFALHFFQYALTFGGVCLGAVPGAVWLLRLRQRWVLPILWTAAGALLYPAIETIPIHFDLQGLIYVGVVFCAFIIGFSVWVYGRRSSKHPDKLESKTAVQRSVGC